MAFSIPIIDENGITVPEYAVVHEEVKQAYRDIYGQDIYLEPDSQDGNLAAIFAEARHDLFSVIVATYNAFSPSTAQGVGLARVVKINGITKQVPTNSVADVKIVGQVGTVITNGIAADTSGNRWFLPATVTIPISGEITVTATAEDKGAIQASAGTITTIATPTLGWASVTNVLAATAGAPVETDVQLRRRQKVSTAIPSRTVLEGIVGAVADLTGVTRYAAYENDTDIADVNGIPAHSISLIVEGGVTAAIAEVIADKKAPGAGTYGTTSSTVVDDFGIPHIINFYRPTVVPITVEITLNARPGYTVTVENRIKQTVVDYLNGSMLDPTDEAVAAALDPTDPNIDPGLAIGDDVELSRLYTPANLFNMTALGSRTYKITQIRIRRGAAALAAADVVIAFNEVSSGAIADVTVITV